MRLTVDLQEDFALNQPLSPLALAAIELLDRSSPDYPLDVLSVIESTLDNPRQVLSAQLFKARGEAVAAMKAEGIEYEERMDLLEAVTYPRPQADLLEAAYNIYRQGHPWVADHALSPKSVARDMYERAMTFAEYTSFYGLARSEGLVLRYLADAYKAMRQTVPEEARTEELADLIEWLGELVRQVDSSLIDEWERLRNPVEEAAHLAADRPPAVTGNKRAFRVLVRNALFRRVELAALRRWDDLGDAGWRRRLRRGGVGVRAGAVFRRARRDRHRRGRPRSWPADPGRAAGRAGQPGRSSTTRPAITTGASRPPSTSTPPTRRESPSSP